MYVDPATTRRSFLRTLAGGAMLSALPGEALAATGRLRVGAGSPTLDPYASGSWGSVADEPFWEMVRAQFSIRPGLTPLNASNLCPAPFPVSELTAQLTRDVDQDPTTQNRGKFGRMKAEATEMVASYLGAEADEILISRNTTESNAIVVNGVPLERGDQVLLWGENHPSNRESWEYRARFDGFDVVRVTTPARPSTAAELIEAFDAAATPRTRVLAFSHVSNLSGVALPAKELCAWARSRGILTVIDGAQTFGAARIDVGEIGCDFYTGSAHKWFMGPREAGILFVTEEQIPRLRPLIVGISWQENGGASGRFGALGQRDDAAVVGVGTTVAFHERIGADEVEARIRYLASEIMRQTEARIPGVSFHTPVTPDLRLGAVVATLPRIEPGPAVQALYRDHDISVSSAGGGFTGIRLSPQVFITLADVEKTVEALAAVNSTA